MSTPSLREAQAEGFGRRARLVLTDGTTFEGFALGARANVAGEVVFTTGMTGYQEVLTDPSFAGQLVTLTAPEIGNTGTNPEDDENTEQRPFVAGLIIQNASLLSSNCRSTEALDQYLLRHRATALAGIDTRALVRTIRDRGAQNAAFGEGTREELLALARSAPEMTGLDLVGQVTPSRSFKFFQPSPDGFGERAARRSGVRIVAVDLGMKRGILRAFSDLGCETTVVPASFTADQVLAERPDGVFISNGPGDPAAVGYAIKTISGLLGKKPIFGICLGHQLLALASGAKTSKLKFGHRGLNQPVKDLETGRVEITSQNHGFVVDLETLPSEAVSTHLHLNDGSSEGLSIPDARAFSVQFHPEASAGPHDSLHLFERFVALIESNGNIA